MQAGDEFKSFKKFQKKLKKFEEAENLKFTLVRSKKLEKSGFPEGSFPEQLQYKEIYYVCAGTQNE